MNRRHQRGVFELPLLWVVIGLGVALLASGAAIWYLDGKVDKAQKEAQEAAAALGKEEQSRKGFQAAAASCSASVEALGDRAAKAEAAYAKGQGVSRGLSDAVQAHISAMINQPRPDGLSECQATLKELNDEIAWRAAQRTEAAKKGATP